jgi:hypothetical protein
MVVIFEKVEPESLKVSHRCSLQGELKNPKFRVTVSKNLILCHFQKIEILQLPHTV